MIAVGLVAPSWLSTVARADLLRQAKGGKIDPDCILVVCQLSGGNDGLNTVVPYSSSQYRKLRPTLGIADDQVLHISEEIGFHPSMTKLVELYKKKKVAVIQNVGYPNANRSHFKSMDIWHSASPDNKLKYGWIGRHFDQQLASHPLNPVVSIGLSTNKPLALQAAKASIPCFASLADIQAMVGDPDSEKRLRAVSTSGGATNAVEQANKSALDAMSYLHDRLAKYESKVTYGNDAFGKGFSQLAQLVATSPQTRVLYFSTGGFDTHAHQADQHAKLLGGLSDAVSTFMQEMELLKLDKKVIVLVFSEFGRRSFENGSGGTDHGAAAPMFLIGSRVKGGVYGPMPDLENLVNGDVKHQIDFRQVYATALDQWMGGDSEVVLGQKFAPIDVFQAS